MKYCYKCGTQLSDEMTFCYNCGTKIVIPNNTSEDNQNYINDAITINQERTNKSDILIYNPNASTSEAKCDTIVDNPLIDNSSVSNTTQPKTKNATQNGKPRRRKAMGIAGMVLAYIASLFSFPLAIASGVAINEGLTFGYQFAFWFCGIPSLVMTILSTIFSFVSRFQSGFANQITSRGVMVSIINSGILIFAILIYSVVQ